MAIIKTFETPILTTIYRSIGWIVIVLGILVAIFILKDGAVNVSAKSMMSYPPFAVAIIDLLITFAIALPMFGIAQVVEYIGKTAFYAELANSNLTSEAGDIKKAIGKVSDQLKKMADNQGQSIESKQAKRTEKAEFIPIPLKAPVYSQPSINCPTCSQRILESNLVNGMNTCPKCSGDFKVEL
jgi:hypothetical protein